MKKLPKVIVILGPTASGKSELAVILGKLFNGEVISADSRQVYKGMNLGSGKVEGKLNKQGEYIYKKIIHHCIDIASPKRQFSVANFQKYGKIAIKKILKKNKLPIICGGTGFWIDALIYDYDLPKIKPNLKLRRQLEKMSIAELFAKLNKLDPARANNIDPKNPRRLIRALEIVLESKAKVPNLKKESPYDCLWLGIATEQKTLSAKIEKRLKERLKLGLKKEVESLHRQGLSWKKLESFGLEYKYISLFLQHKLNEKEMYDKLLTEIKKYSKRQLTWFKRNQEINWVTNVSIAKAKVKDYLAS